MLVGHRGDCHFVSALYWVVKAMCKLTNEDFNYQILMGYRLLISGITGLLAEISRTCTVDS